MKKINKTWSIHELTKHVDDIEFAEEYQREPTVWTLDKKRKLIDSILRDLDIACIYLLKKGTNSFDCIDGRQRIITILSFLGLNSDGEDNSFVFKSSDELLGTKALSMFDNKRWEDFTDPTMQNRLLDFKFNVIEISDVEKDEVNLLFLRLQLGSPLNAGEKLHAMKGDMHDFIFDKMASKKFFDQIKIPPRRFAKELTAAQIAINYFSINLEQIFTRARFVDLQEFFKQYYKFHDDATTYSKNLLKKLDEVSNYLDNHINLKNRAISITLFFLINKFLEEGKKDHEINTFIKFFVLFQKRLEEQISLGIDIDRNYRDLLKFQTYITQAAVEKYAVENRQQFLIEYFEHFKKTGKIKGDR